MKKKETDISSNHNFDRLKIVGARQNNLQNITIEIPKHQIVVFTGVSGSGKSSLVYNTIYTEAQRQLIESFSTFARSRMPKLSRPEVEEIQNLSPTILIDQKKMGKNPRSTVGTVTEINNYLRLLFSRCALPFIGPSFYFSFNNPKGMCPLCHGIGEYFEVNTDNLLDRNKSINGGAILHPDYKIGSIYHKLISGLPLLDANKPLKEFSTTNMHLLLYAEKTHYDDHLLTQMTSMKYEGVITSIHRRYILNQKKNGPKSKRYKHFFKSGICPKCNGTRLNEQAQRPTLQGKNITELCSMELTDLQIFLQKIKHPLSSPILTKIFSILDNLIDIGAEYLSLSQSVATLSGGESQRVKMAKQLDSNLVDMIYILDEPTIGLHPSDVSKIISILKKLKNSGNSVLVIEHDPAIMQIADHIIDIGPKAGNLGGNIMFAGKYSDLLKSKKSITGKFLSAPKLSKFRIPEKYEKKINSDEFFSIENANKFNLKNISVQIPKGKLCCITGVAGSGKSTLIYEYFVKKYTEAISIDQSSIHKSSRSIPLTYIGIFDEIRKIYAKEFSVKPKLFSFNSEGGCPKCKGMGVISFEMNFLDDIKIQCDECLGRRYRPEILEMKVHDKNIHELLELTVDQFINHFKSFKITEKAKILQEVGLGYIKLGQTLDTFSGGECQRLKLALELQKSGNIYVLDEPSTGLHNADIERILRILTRLVHSGNSVIVIEHNLEIISQAEWILDLGPNAGKNGGEIVTQGTPNQIINCNLSKTGKYLAQMY